MAGDCYSLALDLLAAAPSSVRPLVAALQSAWRDWRPSLDEWSVRDVLAHLLDAEIGVTRPRIDRMITEENPLLAVAPLLTPDGDTLALLEEWEAARARDLSFYRALTDRQLARTGRHPYHGVFTVRDLVIELAHHDQDHLRQIAGIVQSALSPEIARILQAQGG